MVYFDKALAKTNRSLIGNMRSCMDGVAYDTVVGTGLSGTIFTARVAPALKKNFAIVRKDDDKSTHSGNRIEGTVGDRWVFADDFVSQGGTMKKVLRMMQEYYPDAVFVGAYMYEATEFCDPDEAAYRWGNWVTDLSIGTRLGPESPDHIKTYRPWDMTPLKAPVDGWAPRFRAQIPMGELKHMTVDYMDGYGRPTIYDASCCIRWGCEDEKALPLIEKVENAAAARGVNPRRLVGDRLDRLPEPRLRKAKPGPSDWGWKNMLVPAEGGLKAFIESVQVADDAVAVMMNKAFEAEGR